MRPPELSRKAATLMAKMRAFLGGKIRTVPALLGSSLVPFREHLDLVERAAPHQVQGLFVRPGKRKVLNRAGHRNRPQMLSLRAEDLNADPRGDIQTSRAIDGNAVGAGRHAGLGANDPFEPG